MGPNTPNLTGRFLRGRGGNAAALGVAQSDAIRNITGNFGGQVLWGGNQSFYPGSYMNRQIDSNTYPFNGSTQIIYFDASRQVPTANENRPANIAVRHLVKALK